MGTGSYDKDKYEKCAKYTPCGDKYDCTTGMVCLQSDYCFGKGEHITGVCQPPPSCEGDCSKYKSPGSIPIECKNGQCVQEGKSQAISVQIIWIVFFGLLILAVGKTTQQYYRSGISLGLIKVIPYVSTFVLYMVLMIPEYSTWAQINPNLTFMNSAETPFMYSGGH